MSTIALTGSTVSVRTILKYTYGLVPIVAGADKFTNLLTDWAVYLRGVESMIPLAPASFMLIVGVIEIVAGVLVFRFTRLGAMIVSAWLVAIAVVLIAGGWYDIAVRDLAMAIGAFCLAKLSEKETARA
jgi:DoxX.